MSINRNGLGKGLSALLGSSNDEDNNEQRGIIELKITDIEPNTNQPRKKFDDIKLTQLSESIKQYGIIQPIIVKKENDTYKIVAGERRWRAARIANIKTIPVIIKELTKKQDMEIALIENLQREDLNPIEKAKAYESLINEYEITQEELSITLGKSRSAITNSLRILGLNDKIKDLIINGELSSGHARALLSIEDDDTKMFLIEEIRNNNYSVRQTENLVNKYLNRKNSSIKEKIVNEEHVKIKDRLQDIFGTKVSLIANNNKGKILIEYYSNEELDRILDLVNYAGNSN